jgi:uncharacterized integral membrane protein
LNKNIDLNAYNPIIPEPRTFLMKDHFLKNLFNIAYVYQTTGIDYGIYYTLVIIVLLLIILLLIFILVNH